MNLISNNNVGFQDLAVHEKFFLESWFGMTHELSLDSYRVRCLNARGIVRELNLELATGRLAAEDLKDLCDEAIEILGRDPLIQVHYSRHHGFLVPFLQRPPQIP